MVLFLVLVDENNYYLYGTICYVNVGGRSIEAWGMDEKKIWLSTLIPTRVSYLGSIPTLRA